MKDEYGTPRLTYFITYNPNYGKEYTIEDIEKPERELYDYLMCDWMTLGRPIPEYENWATQAMERDLVHKQNSAKCKLMADKVATISFEEIEEFFHTNKSDIVRFIDPRLNTHFGIES